MKAKGAAENGLSFHYVAQCNVERKNTVPPLPPPPLPSSKRLVAVGEPADSAQSRLSVGKLS